MQKNTDIGKEGTEHVKGLALKQPVRYACLQKDSSSTNR